MIRHMADIISGVTGHVLYTYRIVRRVVLVFLGLMTNTENLYMQKAPYQIMIRIQIICNVYYYSKFTCSILFTRTLVHFLRLSKNVLYARVDYLHHGNIHVIQSVVVTKWFLCTRFKAWLDIHYWCQSSTWENLLLSEHTLSNAILEFDCLPVTNITTNIPVVYLYIALGWYDMLLQFCRGKSTKMWIIYFLNAANMTYIPSQWMWIL